MLNEGVTVLSNRIVFWGITIGLSQQYTQYCQTHCLVFLLFSLYWTSQGIINLYLYDSIANPPPPHFSDQNVVHVTAAGTFATWYAGAAGYNAAC